MADHFIQDSGDRDPVFAPDATRPLYFMIAIDSDDRMDAEVTPYTLNASVIAPDGDADLILGPGGGCLIGGDIPSMLRELALLIENGQVTS